MTEYDGGETLVSFSRRLNVDVRSLEIICTIMKTLQTKGIEKLNEKSKKRTENCSPIL